MWVSRFPSPWLLIVFSTGDTTTVVHHFYYSFKNRPLHTPSTATHTHTLTCAHMDTGIMGRVPMHPYFNVVSPVSLYILSCGSNTEGCSSCLNMFMLLTHLLGSHSAGCTDRAGQSLTQAPFGVISPLHSIRGTHTRWPDKAVHFHARSDSIACSWQLYKQPGCRIFKLSVDCEIIWNRY